MKKKAILVCVFLALMLATVICFNVIAYRVYQEELATATDQRWLGFASAVLVMIGLFIALYQLDVLVTIYYFLFQRKRIARTILNVLSNLTLVSVFLYSWLFDYIHFFRKYEEIVYILLFAFPMFRLVYFALGAFQEEKVE